MTVSLPDPYAEVEDLADYWGRTLSSAEQGRALVLLGWAAKLILEQPGSEDFDPTTAAMVSMDMVKRAMVGGDGVNSVQQAMADISATVQYVNPMGNLYLTASEVDRLAGSPNGGAFSVALSSNVRVPTGSWSWQPSSQTDDDAD